MAKERKTPAGSRLNQAAKSEILELISQQVALAGRATPLTADERIDEYHKGTSPGPVDQYIKGQPQQ